MVSCGIGCRHGSDPELLCLWRRLVATALTGPLAWEPPCATGAALEKAKTHTHKKKGLHMHFQVTPIGCIKCPSWVMGKEKRFIHFITQVFYKPPPELHLNPARGEGQRVGPVSRLKMSNQI